ncbi:hypothetical protein B0H11DRAFT_1626197, partial [Mycena galericulata]
DTIFPPKPLSETQSMNIIRRHCNSLRPSAFVEDGCAVCGCLVSRKLLTPLSSYQGSLQILVRPGVTRRERFNIDEPISELEGPILAENCRHICVDCET